ncbi:MAG TPA: hypothetical protein VKZ53_19560 [Candidatus Angelobacter sp.]|nr:hypothetical protein [Candidatus Angelobacter sp.]
MFNYIGGMFSVGSTSMLDQWCLQDVLGAGSNPTSTLNVTHFGTSGSAWMQVAKTFAAGDGFNAINVKAMGLVDDGATDNSSALAAVITYACSQVNPPVIEFPATAGSYFWATSASVACQGLRFRGVGFPLLRCPNGCFTNAGQRNVEYYDLQMQGNNVAGAYAISNTSSAASALNNKIHDNFIYNFGSSSAGTGAGIGILSDSENLSIYNNVMGNAVADIFISGPTDSLHIFDNTLSNQNGTLSNGIPARCIDASGGAGAGTMWINHNNLTCEGLGAMRINSQGSWIISENEAETRGSITNSSSAEYEILSGAVVIFRANIGNANNNAGYNFFVGNAIGSSDFSYNSCGQAANFCFNVGTGQLNTYSNNYPFSPTTLYSSDYPGIEEPYVVGPGPGRSWGCADPTGGGLYLMCIPETQFTSVGQFAIRSTLHPTKGIHLGTDSTRGAQGASYMEAVDNGCCGLPLQLNPSFNGAIELGGALAQASPGVFAGSCTMSGSNTCTITGIKAVYNSAPLCFANIQSTVVMAGSCALSGSTITITAAAPNNAVWGAMLVGNPN